MLVLLPSKDDVVAIRFSGKLERADIDQIFDLLETAMAHNETTHLYVEAGAFEGFSLEALGEDVKRGFGLLGKLDRFGRVAFVSDEGWMRWAAKIESALLPNISYETFTTEERDQALAWVEGKEPLPHGTALKIIETDRPDVFGYELKGRMRKEEIGAIADFLNGAIEEGKPVSLLGRIRSYEGFQPSGILQANYLRLEWSLFKNLKRYALVGGPAWLKPTVEALGPLFRIDIRCFAEDEEAAAWEWLGAKPVSERAAVG